MMKKYLLETNTPNSWSDDTSRLFSFRLNQLNIGDALICSETGWRVLCIEESGQPFYQLLHGEEPIVGRRRRDSLLTHLLDNDVPRTLVYCEQGAMPFINFDNIEELVTEAPHRVSFNIGVAEIARAEGVNVLSPLTHYLLRRVEQLHEIVHTIINRPLRGY